MSYIPKPGTLPARVIDWLEESRPDGTKVAASTICDELGVYPTAFVSKLGAAIRFGFLTAEKRVKDARLQWFVGFGKSQASVADDRIAARVIQYLSELPPGTQVSTVDLAEAIGVSMASIANMRAKLNGSARAKLRTQVVEGHGVVHWWSLSEFDPIEPSDDGEDMPPRRHAPEIQPRPGPFLPGVDVGMGARRITPVQVHAGA